MTLTLPAFVLSLASFVGVDPGTLAVVFLGVVAFLLKNKFPALSAALTKLLAKLKAITPAPAPQPVVDPTPTDRPILDDLLAILAKLAAKRAAGEVIGPVEQQIANLAGKLLQAPPAPADAK